MKICLVAKTCDPRTGGIGRHIFELSNALMDRGHDVTVLTMKGNIPVGLEAEVVELGSRRINSTTFDPYLAVPKFYRYLCKHGDDFDVVHAHEIPSLSVYLARKRGLDAQFVYTVHGVAYELISRPVLKPLAKILHFPERLAVKESDKIVAVSEHTKEETVEHYGINEDKIEAIHNGVDTEKFYNSIDFENRLLYVGYLIERKGSDIVVDSFIDIANEFSETDLVLVGKGRMSDELREKVISAGLEDRVSFRSDVSDEELRDLYSGSVFVMPSKYEGQGIVYVEAMSCGAPVIGCDNSAIPEMIEDGVNGYLVDRCVDSLSEAFTNILGDDSLRSSMGERSREKAKSFDWSLIAARTEELYEGSE